MQKCINHEEYWFHVKQFILVSANSYFNFHILFRYIMYYTFHCELPHYTVHVSLPFLLIHLKAGTVHSGNSSVIVQSNLPAATTDTAQKIKFSIQDFFSKCDQIHRKLQILPHLLKKSLTENFIFCAVWKWRAIHLE